AARTATKPPTTTTTTIVPPAGCTPEEKAAFDPLATVAPDVPLAPGQLPDGPTMQKIRTRGRLVVGVDENTPNFGVRDDNGQLVGLEIDLVRELARAIWPDDPGDIDRRIKWVTVVTEQKVPYVHDGKVDLTASVVTIDCDRSKQVAFSSAYFTTPQRVMVSIDSPIQTIADLGDKKVCATAGSSTIALLENVGARPVPVEARTDCLVKLQDGKVDAIATHDTILFGLHQQDAATTRIVPDDLSPGKPSNYGVALPHDDVAFASFVNGELQRMRVDGRLADLYERWLRSKGYEPPPIPDPHYRGEP
ncbi:MAG: transporter substrate-binding domain-containing protein, partial [Acidimicrobiia bacterium]